VSTTQAQAAVLDRVAARFDGVHDTLYAMLTHLLREVETTRADWQGRGGASFDHVSLAWAEDQRRLLAALTETAAAIRSAGAGYATSDESAAGRVRQATLALPL
jgi:ESAT-6 family protein